jgi:hypothetical protein
MKKLLLIAASVGFLFASCQKDDMSSPGTSTSATLKSAPTSPVPIVPSTFLKKVLVEEFTGTSYPLVPEANRDLHALVLSGKDRVYSTGLHLGDVMNNIQSNFVLSAMGNTNPAIPCGLVNRTSISGNLFLDSKHFAAATSTLLVQPVNCGISMSTSYMGNSAAVSVTAGFNGTMTGTYRMVTYLTEDKVVSLAPAFYQLNGFNNTPGSPYYNAGNPIHGMEYYNVIRRTLSRLNGDPIASNLITPGGTVTFNYQMDLPQKLAATSQYMIISFIVDMNTNEVVNVQQCTLGSNKGWN